MIYQKTITIQLPNFTDKPLSLTECCVALFCRTELGQSGIAKELGISQSLVAQKIKKYTNHEITRDCTEYRKYKFPRKYFIKSLLSREFNIFLKQTNLKEDPLFYSGTEFQSGWWWRKWRQLQGENYE